MKKLISLLLVLFVVALGGTYAWRLAEIKRIQSDLGKFEAEAGGRRMINVEFVVDAPKETPADQPLFVSGSASSLGAWDAAGKRLDRGPDGKYHGTAEVMSGIEYGFKITRGTWGTVERAPGDKDIPNRLLKAEKEGPVLVSVATWIDGGKAVPGRVTLAGDIRLHKKFPSKLLANERNLVVYLPPDYEKDEAARYPVLYVQDGQNVFDESTSFAGIEWRLDEAAQELIKSGTIPPMIIVGVYNSEQRTDEFTPPGLSATAKGDLFARFMVEELKPFIDSVYRTKADRDNTGICGASMGGLIALHIAKAQPQTFSRVVALSPWLRTREKALPSDYAGPWAKNTRFYIEMGSVGGTNYPGDKPIEDARALASALEGAGLTYVELDGVEHNETAWQKHTVAILQAVYHVSPK